MYKATLNKRLISILEWKYKAGNQIILNKLQHGKEKYNLCTKRLI